MKRPLGFKKIIHSFPFEGEIMYIRNYIPYNSIYFVGTKADDALAVSGGDTFETATQYMGEHATFVFINWEQEIMMLRIVEFGDGYGADSGGKYELIQGFEKKDIATMEDFRKFILTMLEYVWNKYDEMYGKGRRHLS